MATRDELVAAVGQRYARADRAQRGRILDEFTQLTGFHRKHAARVLRDGRADGRGGPRRGRRVYDEAVREALMVLWEASDRVCGKRLRPLLRSWWRRWSGTGAYSLRQRFALVCRR